MSVKVRRIRPEEYEQVGQLTFAGFGHAEPGAPAPDAERAALLLDVAERDAQGVVLVAEDDGGEGGSGSEKDDGGRVLLGTATLLPTAAPLSRQAREGEAELRLLAVLPTARKRGIGQALLDEAARRARGWGAHAMVLDTAESNERSQRLYRRRGFIQQHERTVARPAPKANLVVYTLDLSKTEENAPQAQAQAQADAGNALGAARTFLRQHPLVDTHNDLPLKLRRIGYELSGLDRLRPEFHTDLVRLRSGGVGAQFWSAYVPSTLPEPEAALAALEQIDAIVNLVATYPDRMVLAYTSAQVRQAFARGQIASLLGVEGGHSIARSPGVLRTLGRLGVRYLTLTHNHNTAWADAATDTARVGGLSAEGLSVLEALNRHGILADLSHTSEAVQLDALAHSRAPVIFSHSSARALNDHPRNVSDTVLEQVARKSGVVQVSFVPAFVSRAYASWSELAGARRAELGLASSWPPGPRFAGAQPDPSAPDSSDHTHGAPSVLTVPSAHREFAAWLERNSAPPVGVAEVADHLDHVREVAGVEHVGVGGDYDGVASLPHGLEDVSGYPNLVAELLVRGWSAQELELLVSGNILRVLEQAQDVAEEPLWPGSALSGSPVSI